jgi:hypothetical protein
LSADRFVCGPRLWAHEKMKIFALSRVSIRANTP